ncbi:MAG: hypothetical protein PHS24_05000 [Bacilli bacterium]|nr:hypothetical protein [Tissierellia bacterium]MDD4706544.1 hypothetical protein [Bacilli bacterium]
MKKINLGVVLIIITLITLTIYIIYDENSKAKDRENIKSFLDEYFAVHDKYSMLEKEARDIDKVPDINEYNRYLSEMKNDLSKYILDSKLNDIYDVYKQRLDKQFYGKYMIDEYSTKVKDIVEYNFQDPYISVVIDTNFTLDRDERVSFTMNENTGRYEGRVKNLSINKNHPKLIVLEKVDSKYKIVMDNVLDIVLGYEDGKMGGM